MLPYFIFKKTLPVFPKKIVPNENGLIALGGELNIPTLIEAYSKGIFPWSGEDPIPWYSPDPRLVLFPEKYYVSKRLERIIKKDVFKVSFDVDFKRIIKKCSNIHRKGQNGTWINEKIIGAYYKLFNLEIAHCVAVYYNDILCGGLYGLSFGKCFFGESMFSDVSNSSKVALYFLTKFLIEKKINIIDCQQVTPHMQRMGGILIDRSLFLKLLKEYNSNELNPYRWIMKKI